MLAAPAILPDEKELFSQLAKGDQQAFTQIFYHYTQRIYHFILGKTKSASLTEEIVQEVFIGVWNNREKFEQVENFEAYLFSMAANKTAGFLRKMASEKHLRQQVWLTVQTMSNRTEDGLSLKECQALIQEAVDRLPPQKKKIFLLSRQEGLSHAEIARMLNLSPHTVNNHLTEALRQVRAYIQQAPGDTFTLLMILLKINEGGPLA